MPAVFRTEAFAEWLRGLKDSGARGRIAKRIERLAAGNAGDVGPVGEGVSELRLHFGPGYRVYYVERGDTAIVLWGGTKKTQEADIDTARNLARRL